MISIFSRLGLTLSKKVRKSKVKRVVLTSEIVKKPEKQASQPPTKKKFKSFSATESDTVKQVITQLERSDILYLEKTIKRFLTKTVPEGAGYKRIKAYIRTCVKTDEKSSLLGSDDFLMMALKEMKARGEVSKNTKKKIWAYVLSPYELKDLSVKEISYFKHLGLNDGWFRLGKNPMDAIQWLYRELSWQDFEKFCCVILKHNKVTNVRLSDRRKSGADGGVDGHGKYQLGSGDVVDIAIQAKQYRPDRQVQTQEVRDFKGALDEFELEYGIFVATCIFSDETIRINQSGVGSKKIQLIDQEDIIRCMLFKADSPHGYGLHKTDIGMYYLNPDMLKYAMDKY